MDKKSIHLKGLNGIRAIAALSVVLSHTLLSLEFFGLKKVEGGWNFASYGVTMFFTLSGFLITFLLLKEKETFSTISIRDFYIRRILRIWPLYYFYILLVLIVSFGHQQAGLGYYICMGANIPYTLLVGIPLLTHYWSLGVEEQFYLFWPWLVKYCRPLKSVAGFLILFLSIKAILRIFIPGSFAYQFLCNIKFECMAIGALWAILLSEGKKYFIFISFHKITQMLSWLVLLLAAMGKLKIPDFINHDIFSVATANIILNVAFNEKTLIGLENRVFNFLGRISYGVYIYHLLIIYCLVLLFKGRMTWIDNFSKLPLVIFVVTGLTILVAWISFEFFEKRFLKLKDRFSKVFSRS